MKPFQAVWFIMSCLFLYSGAAMAQDEIQLKIRLRHSDGTAASGETITVERLPEEEPALWQAQDNTCITDTNGECAWFVTPGLYQLLFSRPLDDLSALAVAEGGLRGFGLTVGDEAITYHFTFHSDGLVYFDAAPDLAAPAPIIPEPNDRHDWAAPTPTMTAESVPPTAGTTIRSEGVTTTQGAITDRPWRPMVIILFGLVLGGGLYLLQPRLAYIRSRIQPKTAEKQSAHSSGEEEEA
jgi:hypothetical protein